MLKTARTTGIAILLLLIGFAYGYLSHRNRIFPADVIGQLKNAYTQRVANRNDLPADFGEITIKSQVDGGEQKALWFGSDGAQAQPLVVDLHVWAGNFEHVYKNGSQSLPNKIRGKNWNYVKPDFRGPSNSPEACCSDRVISDIDEAIDHLIETANVDRERIFVVGGSGGGYTSLCMFMNSRHAIRGYYAWVPITDLAAWHSQLKSSDRHPYHDDILRCTSSEGGILDFEEARKRSPLFMKFPDGRLDDSSLKLYAGIHDGFSGSVPITHAINFYNKILSDLGSDDDDYVTQAETLHMLESRKSPSSDDFGTIADRSILLRRSSGNLSLIIFDGGHELLIEQVERDIENAL